MSGRKPTKRVRRVLKRTNKKNNNNANNAAIVPVGRVRTIKQPRNRQQAAAMNAAMSRRINAAAINQLAQAGFGRGSDKNVSRYPKPSSMAKFGLPDCCIRGLKDLYSFGIKASRPAPIDAGSHSAATANVSALSLTLNNPYASGTNFENYIVHGGDVRYGILRTVASPSGFVWEPYNPEAGGDYEPPCYLQCSSAGLQFGTFFNPRTTQFLLSHYLASAGGHVWPLSTDSEMVLILGFIGGGNNSSEYKVDFYLQSNGVLDQSTGWVSGQTDVTVPIGDYYFSVSVESTGGPVMQNFYVAPDDDSDATRGGAGSPYVLEPLEWNTIRNLLSRSSQIRMNSSAIVITNTQNALVVNGAVVAGRITSTQSPTADWDTYLFGQPSYYCNKFQDGLFSGFINNYTVVWESTAAPITNMFASPAVNVSVVHITSTLNSFASTLQTELKAKGWVDYLTNDQSIAQSDIANERYIWEVLMGYCIKTLLFTDNPNHVKFLGAVRKAIQYLKAHPDERQKVFDILKGVGKVGLQAGSMLAALI